MDSFLDALRPLKAAQKSDPGSRSNALSGGSGSGPGSALDLLPGSLFCAAFSGRSASRNESIAASWRTCSSRPRGRTLVLLSLIHI